MITEIKGYVKVSRKAFTKVTALIVALAIMCAVTAFAASPSFYVDIYDGNEITRVLTSKSDPKTIVSQALSLTTEISSIPPASRQARTAL